MDPADVDTSGIASLLLVYVINLFTGIQYIESHSFKLLEHLTYNVTFSHSQIIVIWYLWKVSYVFGNLLYNVDS